MHINKINLLSLHLLTFFIWASVSSVIPLITKGIESNRATKLTTFEFAFVFRKGETMMFVWLGCMSVPISPFITSCMVFCKKTIHSSVSIGWLSSIKLNFSLKSETEVELNFYVIKFDDAPTFITFSFSPFFFASFFCTIFSVLTVYLRISASVVFVMHFSFAWFPLLRVF